MSKQHPHRDSPSKPAGLRRSTWPAIAALISIVMAALLFPLAVRTRDPGRDIRWLGYALEACLLAANLALGMMAERALVKALAFLAAAACLVAIWQAALLNVARP